MRRLVRDPRVRKDAWITVRQRHELSVPVSGPPDLLQALLAARPTSWLRSFLLLASVTAAPDVPAPTRSFYRLRPAQPTPAGGVTAALVGGRTSDRARGLSVDHLNPRHIEQALTSTIAWHA